MGAVVARAVATGAAPGKIILFGEHAAVYGRPAIAAALNCGLGATVEADPGGPQLLIPAWGLNVRVRPDGAGGFESLSRAFALALTLTGLACADDRRLAVTMEGELPPSVGLGSSAAFSVALLRALSHWRHQPLSEADLLAAAFELERVFHGTPSGVDHTVSALGGCLRFQRGREPAWRRVVVNTPLPLVIAFAPREASGRQTVERLRGLHDADPEVFDRVFDAIGALVDAGERALGTGDLQRLGTLFNLNHALLRACGVSSPVNEALVALAREQGALGAKLTGAGGGGAVIALCPGDHSTVIEAFERRGYGALSASVDGGR